MTATEPEEPDFPEYDDLNDIYYEDLDFDEWWLPGDDEEPNV